MTIIHSTAYYKP